MTRKRKITIAVIVAMAVLLLNMALCFLSAYNFHTYNYFRGFTGYLTLQWTDASVVEIRGGENKVILVDTVNENKSCPTLAEYMEARGYIKVKSVGTHQWYEKDGERQEVSVTLGSPFSKRDYTIWQWE